MKKRTFLKSLGALALAPLAAITRTAEAAPPPLLKKLYRCTHCSGNLMLVSRTPVRMRDLRNGDMFYCRDEHRIYETVGSPFPLPASQVCGVETNLFGVPTFRGETIALGKRSFYACEVSGGPHPVSVYRLGHYSPLQRNHLPSELCL